MNLAGPRRPSRIPFRNLSQDAWVNLGAAVTFLLLAAYTLASYAGRGLFEYWGADFRAFRSAGEVALESGYGDLYDLSKLEPPQRALFETYASPAVQSKFSVIPVPYLPVFVAPFQLFVLVDPVAGFVAWTVLGGLALAAYFRRLEAIFGVGGRSRGWRLLLLSLPAYFTLAFGQVNLLLLIGVGEFLIWTRREQAYIAGLWLGALALKPQMLVLFVPALILKRSWRTLAGVLTSTAAIAIASWWMAGAEGISQLVALWLGYVEGMPTNYPESMMNLRALMLLATPVLGSTLAMVATLVTTAIVAAAGIWVWVRQRGPQAALRAGTAVYAASSAIAWHAHVHLALPLAALVLAGEPWEKRRQVATASLVLVPSLSFALVGIFVDAGLAHRVAGWTFLAINLSLLGTTIEAFRRTGADSPPRVPPSPLTSLPVEESPR